MSRFGVRDGAPTEPIGGETGHVPGLLIRGVRWPVDGHHAAAAVDLDRGRGDAGGDVQMVHHALPIKGDTFSISALHLAIKVPYFSNSGHKNEKVTSYLVAGSNTEGQWSRSQT
eukprot:SAG31_NODE_10097_length_1183_cov_1.302583_1_plen_114_part_00